MKVLDAAINIDFIFLMLLYVTGESIISPGARQGLIPLAIPLSKNSCGMGFGLITLRIFQVQHCL